MKTLRVFLCFVGLIMLAGIADLAWATVTTTSSSVTAQGNGSTTVFSFPFVGVQATDITVTYTNSSGNATVLSPAQYTLSLNAAPAGAIWGVGGTVTYPLTGSPIATGTTLSITRNIPYKQTVSSNQGQLFPQAVEQALDLIDMQVQQVVTLASNALRAPTNDSCTSLGALPPAAARANQMLGFDSTGCNPIAAQPSSALVSSAMQPVVAASSIAAANNLLGINTNFNTPVGAELDWPGLTAPSYWKLENGAAVSRTTYSALLSVLAPTVACTITAGSSTITGISSTVGWGTGWIIESPGSSALAAGQTIATVSTNSVTITGGNASGNATSCEVFPYGTAQDGTFDLPNAAGVVYAGIDTSNTYLTSTYCSGNPAYLNAVCGAQSTTLASGNLPSFTTSTYTPGTISSNETNIIKGTPAGVSLQPGSTGVFLFNSLPASGQTSTTIPSFTPTFTGSDTAFSTLQPTRMRNRIIFAGAP